MSKDKNLKDVTPDQPYSETSIPSTPKPHYPSFRLKIEDIPEAERWEINGTYLMVIGVKMKRLTKDEDGSEVRFDVIKVKPIKKSK